MKLIRQLYHKVFPVRVQGKNNVIKWKQKSRNIRIDINGDNNTVIIEKAATLSNLHISIQGDNNKIFIGKNCRIYGPCYFYIRNGANVTIGENTGLRGVSLLADSAPINIGANCMTSYEIIIRNNDSHIIVDRENNKLLNAPLPIVIGDKVWLAQRVTILKGATIGSDSIIGFGSIVTKDIPNNSIAVGIPAKVVKSGIKWEK